MVCDCDCCGSDWYVCVVCGGWFYVFLVVGVCCCGLWCCVLLFVVYVVYDVGWYYLCSLVGCWYCVDYICCDVVLLLGVGCVGGDWFWVDYCWCCGVEFVFEDVGVLSV